MGVGLRLKMALRERKMTIKELSEKSGISLNTLYSITKRDTENVDNVILGLICDTLFLSWRFFESCSPFDDLSFLQQNKEKILIEIEKYSSFSLEGRKASDVGIYELWKTISTYVEDIEKSEDGSFLVYCSYEPAYDPNSELGAEIDDLAVIFSKLDSFGRNLVLDYAKLLASNPGFLLKKPKQ